MSEDLYILAHKNEDGTFSACEYRNHPKPSGCTRYIPTFSDKRKWETAEEAIRELDVSLKRARGEKEL